MKELVVEWRHYDKDGSTCDRCAATGSSVATVIADIGREFASMGITVTFIETRLTESLMEQSNMILFNGVPLEALLDEASAGQTHCHSCSCMTGSETNCRAVQYQGNFYEEIPEELIRAAAYKAAESL